MRNLILIVTAGLAFVGCAHTSADRQLDQKVAAESGIKTTADLKQEANRELSAAQGLTQQQKDELLKLRDAIQATDRETWEQTLQLRAVLIKDMLSPKYSQAEVNRIQGRMRKLENRRLSMQFEAIDKANKILGHERRMDAKDLNDLLFVEPRQF